MLHIMEVLEMINGTYDNMALFADTTQKVGVPKINKEHPDISVHYVTFSIQLVLYHYTAPSHQLLQLRQSCEGAP